MFSAFQVCSNYFCCQVLSHFPCTILSLPVPMINDRKCIPERITEKSFSNNILFLKYILCDTNIIAVSVKVSPKLLKNYLDAGNNHS